ncbi:MAG TPA: type II toxin-antitoxin system ParD family antitoxin [Polyangiaceae bacterium]|nr:type II toxin-antitoxin system ParD family antitoxin [Polyangiaceae bacterium]
MARPIDPREIPEEVARFAEAQVAAGRFASVADVLLAGKQALEEREERVRALRRAGEEGLASLREHGPQLESDEEFEAFMDEAAAEIPHDWTDYLRYRFEEGRKAIERGEYFSGPPAELIARIRERVEAKHR